MADASVSAPTFPRGSAVLDYWLVHAEGLTVQPLGARVEEVVVAAPVGRAEALIVRSRMMRRRRTIPAASIASVAPSAGELLLDGACGAWFRPVRRCPELDAGRRCHGIRLVASTCVTAQRGDCASDETRRWSDREGSCVARATPRGRGARAGGTAAARMTLALTVLLARGARWCARELERAAASAAERGRASLAERRAPADRRARRVGSGVCPG